MAMPQENMIPGPTAMIVAAGRSMIVMVVMAVVMPVMDMPRMNVIVRHGISLTENRDNVAMNKQKPCAQERERFGRWPGASRGAVVSP